MRITVIVDGTTYTDDVEPRQLLVHYLRERLGKVGTVIGCDTSNCGACTVHLNGQSVKSCSVLAVQADGAEVTTIEGIGRRRHAAPRAAGIPRQSRPPVRVLHARHDHAVDRPARRPSRSGRGRDPAWPGGQPLPLHRLPEHRPRGPSGRRLAGGEAVTATMPEHEIGKARLRKEDARLITGRTRWTDNMSMNRLAAPGDPAQPGRARADHLDRHVRREGDARRDRRLHRRRLRRRAGQPAVRVADHARHEGTRCPVAGRRHGELRR